MKKGIDVKIIGGNMGIPKPVMTDKMKAEIQEWRLAADNANNHWTNAFREFYMDKLCPVEDIDYIDVTDEAIEKGWQTVQKQLTQNND